MVRPLAANLSFLFKDQPFLSRFGAAATCGFRHVEFMFAGDGAYLHDAKAVKKELDEHGLNQVLLNAPAGDWANGDRGLAGVVGRDADFQETLKRGVDFAAEIGCPRVHVMAGTIAGGADEDTLVQRLKWASGVAADAKITLLVEPLNPIDFPGCTRAIVPVRVFVASDGVSFLRIGTDLVPDASTALRVLDGVDKPNCKLQLDFYHLAMAGGGLVADGSRKADAPVDAAKLEASVRQLLPRAAHVQLANPPSRNEPGVGTVDFVPLLELLDERGYDGYVGCEYKPSGGDTTEASIASVAWARGHFG